MQDEQEQPFFEAWIAELEQSAERANQVLPDADEYPFYYRKGFSPAEALAAFNGTAKP